MTRINGLTIAAGLVFATCVWFTASRADDEPAAPAPADQVSLLVSRIEKLEKRIAVLEGREQATRQASADYFPRTPQALDHPLQPVEPARPKARFFLLQH